MRPPARNPRIAWAIGLTLAALGAAARAADAPEPAPGRVVLNFPENVDLKTLIDYVGKRQGVNFLYDEQIGNQRVTIKAPTAVPADSLMTLLDSALRMKGLAMSATDVPGLMRIEAGKAVTASSIGPYTAADPRVEARPTLAVTRVFQVRHVTAQRAEEVIKPFLSAPTANFTAVPEHDLMIVTDYATNLRRLEELLALVDRPGREALVRFVAVTHLEAAAMAQRVTQLLAAKAKARGAAAPAAARSATVLAEERTNQVVVVGGPEDVEEVTALLRSLDVPLGLEARIYALTAASPEHLDRLARELIGDLAAKRLYRAAADRDARLLIVTATPEIHKQVEALRQAMERPAGEAQSPIRFYKLKNAKAADVLATLQSIEGGRGLGAVSVDGVSAERPAPPQPFLRGPTEAEVNRRAPGGAAGAAPPPALRLPNARVMADEASNTIIIVAEPSIQAVYEKLIARLDVRRPQVLVEATVVAIDTTNDFSLGVELSNAAAVNGSKGTLLTFSSFGLSTVDAATGALTLKPGTGFNGALLGADIANVVIRALETDSRAKVLSRPSVLINDNATGTLVSESEEPFTTVTASGVAGATTSFGGFASAGTTIKVTPQISEGDHLKLVYEITLSSFGDERTDVLPPARQTNALTSEATIPDGHTIVVGGLTRETLSDRVDRVPLLGRIPILEYLFTSRSKDAQRITLFVFIRAVILRDDKFEDLKVLSCEAAGRVELGGDHPTSEPIEVP
jgi:general secretion pathway protein D